MRISFENVLNRTEFYVGAISFSDGNVDQAINMSDFSPVFFKPDGCKCTTVRYIHFHIILIAAMQIPTFRDGDIVKLVQIF